MAMKNKVRRKPTAKEIANAIIEINNKLDYLYKVVRELDAVLGLYVNYNGDKEKFNDFCEKKFKALEEQTKKEKNEQKTDGKADILNLQGDTDGEGSGTKGVRAESK
jgi:pentose-5-phosphate-3-epimerase